MTIHLLRAAFCLLALVFMLAADRDAAAQGQKRYKI